MFQIQYTNAISPQYQNSPYQNIHYNNVHNFIQPTQNSNGSFKNQSSMMMIQEIVPSIKQEPNGQIQTTQVWL